MLQIVLAATLLALQAGAVWAALRAIRNARTPQGAVGWVVFLIAAPYLALPVFLFLGHSRLPGYVTARRSSHASIATQPDFDPGWRTDSTRLPDRLGRTLAGFERMAGLPAMSGNALRLLIDGPATFEAIFAAIERAERYVLVQTYILRDDDTGRALQRRLIDRARAGCTVRLLYDAIGSHRLPDSYLAPLREAGVIAADFHSLRKPHSRFQINFRSHRKIVVVDGHAAFLGGHNVGDEYLGRDARIGRWRDTHLVVSGPAVAQLQLIFAEDWAWATEERLDLAWHPAPAAANMDALIVAPGPADVLETGSLYFCNAIHAAQDRVWIASPYFVPDRDILTALSLAALRGVDVRILVAARRDNLFVWLAAFAYFDEMLDAGVRIFRYTDGFMHQKALVVDDAFASVGTLNLDNRSCRLNFEVTALVFDDGFARTVAAMLDEDFTRSQAYATRLAEAPGLLRRNGARVARLMAPIL
ncbi:cardiolipin synthase [Rhodovulum euryhalinum]|uniref:Cardiolipin synthase n=1 Tax=Rhodovulum euryhalinum TaxID=35805 RepID=A0A4R2KJE7_9RHOB|nr:cardiolipin synthase [Rhodovulum euryhalinum]TCO74021.1 cardiolipin synthase [Rhodovulum euryhalinum]